MNRLNRNVTLTFGLVAVMAGCPAEDEDTSATGVDPGASTDTGTASIDPSESSGTESPGTESTGGETETGDSLETTTTDPDETGTTSTDASSDSDSTDTGASETTSVDDTTTGADPVTFDDIDQFFQACTPCHPNQGVPTNHNGILGFNPPGTNLPYVDPGNPSGSFLYIKLGGDGDENLPNFTGPMPPNNGLAVSNPAAFALIEQWILDGALP